METQTLASQTPPLWQSQLASWLRNPPSGRADPPRHRAPDSVTRTAAEKAVTASPSPAWPRVFPGL